jgi:ribulose 1,5-bisphosphate synthetase/thiazole synthase
MSRSRPEIDTHPNSLAANALKARTSDVVVIGAGPAGTGTVARVVLYVAD